MMYGQKNIKFHH